MMIKLDLTIADPIVIQNNLERFCCEGKQTYECYTHFLTAGLKAQLRESVLADKKGTTAKILAELGKYDTCREFFFDEAIIDKLIKNLSSSDMELLAQSSRALANLCYELNAVQTLIIEKNGLDAVSSILKSHKETNSEASKQLRAAAIGLLLNLITDNPPAHSKVMSSGLPSHLLGFARGELDSNEVTNLSQHVILILVTLAESVPMEEVFTLPVCKVAVELLGVCKGPLFYLPALEFLEEASLADPVKLTLVEAGLFELLSKQLEEHPKNYDDEEESATFALIGRVLANILTGDEAMEYVYTKNHPSLLDRLSCWLKSDEYNLAYSAALCVGNIARTDQHSQEIVSRGLQKHVLTWLSSNNADMKMQHALLSTLRNLAIPKENKKVLLSDGALDVLSPLVNLDIRGAAPVIFKLVGSWRQLVEGQQPVALKLGSDVKLIEQLVAWSDAAMCPWVSSEALRLLCSLINVSRDKSVTENVLKANAMQEITKLLTSQHAVMQMEAVNALTISGAILKGATCNFEAILVEVALGEKIKLNLQTPDLNPQLFEAIFTMLDTLLKYDKIKSHVKRVQVMTALETAIESKEPFAKFKPRLANLKNLL